MSPPPFLCPFGPQTTTTKKMTTTTKATTTTEATTEAVMTTVIPTEAPGNHRDNNYITDGVVSCKNVLSFSLSCNCNSMITVSYEYANYAVCEKYLTISDIFKWRINLYFLLQSAQKPASEISHALKCRHSTLSIKCLFQRATTHPSATTAHAQLDQPRVSLKYTP